MQTSDQSGSMGATGKSVRVAVPSSGNGIGHTNVHAIRGRSPGYGRCKRSKCARATTGQPRTLQSIALRCVHLQIDEASATMGYGSAAVPMRVTSIRALFVNQPAFIEGDV